jgi:hypothetical protein
MLPYRIVALRLSLFAKSKNSYLGRLVLQLIRDGMHLPKLGTCLLSSGIRRNAIH